MPPHRDSRPRPSPRIKPRARLYALAAGLACLALGLAMLWMGVGDLRLPGGLLCIGTGLWWIVLRQRGAVLAQAAHAGRAGASSFDAPAPTPQPAPQAAPLVADAASASPPQLAAPLTPETLNAALCAYVATFPSPERLRAHLEANGLTAHAAQFELELKGAARVAESFIYAAAGREKWDAAFNERFFQAVAKQHPWISRESFRSLGAFGQYLNWHDGLEL